MAARIQQDFNVDPELIRGDNGIFDVMADGRCIYSKHQTGCFPTDDEISELLGQL